jgi:hypothetical protein
MELHTGLRSVFPLDPDGSYLVRLRARDAVGRVLDDRWLNGGEPLSRRSALDLDFSCFADHMKDAVLGMTETVLISDRQVPGPGCHYYLSSQGFTYFLNEPRLSINQSDKAHRYRGFSPHFVDETVRATSSVMMNVSTDGAYARTAHVVYEVKNASGRTVRDGVSDIPPFGVLWLDVAGGTDAPGMYTVFSSCDGSAMISLVFTATIGGGLGVDHTIPPPTQMVYGTDMTSGWRGRYRSARESVGLKIRYRLNRVDHRALFDVRARS